MAQSVKRLTSAQVMISQFLSSNRTSGSGLTAQSLDPASHSVSFSLSLSALPLPFLSLSLSKINSKRHYLFNAVSSSMPCLTLQVSVRQEQKQEPYDMVLSYQPYWSVHLKGPQCCEASSVFLEMCTNNNKSSLMPTTPGEAFSKALPPGWSSLFHHSQTTTVSSSSKSQSGILF